MLKKILLAEDNDIEASFVKYLLKKREDINLIHCVNGTEVIEQLEKDICPYLIILDINMPQLNGIDTIIRIREMNILCPIIILSTSNEPSDVNKCYCCGANSYIVKTVDFKVFTETISRIIEYWLYFNQRCYYV